MPGTGIFVYFLFNNSLLGVKSTTSVSLFLRNIIILSLLLLLYYYIIVAIL